MLLLLVMLVAVWLLWLLGPGSRRRRPVSLSPLPASLPTTDLALLGALAAVMTGPWIRESGSFWFYWGQERSDARGQVACLLPYWALLEAWDRWRGRGFRE
jgi:hypothetical protein